MKKVLLTVGSALVISALFAKRKINDVTNIVNNLKIGVKKINDINFAIGSIDVNLDLSLTNQTNIDFSASTGNLLSLVKIEIFTDTGIHVATAVKSVNNLSLEAYGNTVISDIDASIPMTNLTDVAISLIRQQPDKLIIKAHVKIFGKNYII